MIIRLYVKPECPASVKAQEFLTRLGRAFVVRDIAGDLEAKRELLLIIGRTDVPVLTAGYHAAVGFDERNWLKVLAHGDEVAMADPFALPEELGPDPSRI
ncbi:MAG: glutaredoxin family protein [Acidobacteriota bacterium]